MRIRFKHGLTDLSNSLVRGERALALALALAGMLVANAQERTDKGGVQSEIVPDWENPQMIGKNKLPYHSTLQLPSREGECKEIRSLDGRWRFHWAKDPQSRPADFYREDYDVSQ